jgi:hypothetical protein
MTGVIRSTAHRSGAMMLAAAALFVAAPAAPQAVARDWCADVRGDQRCEIRELTMRTRGDQLLIDVGANGSIQVEGYQGDAVRVTARVLTRGRNDAAARELAQSVEIRTTDGELRATGPRTTGRNSWSVSVRVQVPMGSGIDARTTNGSVTVRGTHAAAQARTTNGSITLDDVAGRVDVRTTNGTIRAAISAAADTPDGVQLRTTNGAVHLALPERTSARLELSTTNGSITTDLPVTVQGSVSRRRLSGVLGSGGPEIRVSTTNGSIRITQR